MTVDDLVVKVTYLDASLKPRYCKTYPLREYTDQLQEDLRRVITDVEDLCYLANDNKEKDEWSDATFSLFNKIKHKLLDKAGDIGRLPSNLDTVDHETLTGFVARILNEGGGTYGESCVGQAKRDF